MGMEKGYVKVIAKVGVGRSERVTSKEPPKRPCCLNCKHMTQGKLLGYGERMCRCNASPFFMRAMGLRHTCEHWQRWKPK